MGILCWQVAHLEDGLEAIIFTADGDMRQALNNLQATHSGFGLVNRDNVYKARLLLLLQSAQAPEYAEGHDFALTHQAAQVPCWRRCVTSRIRYSSLASWRDAARPTLMQPTEACRFVMLRNAYGIFSFCSCWLSLGTPKGCSSSLSPDAYMGMCVQELCKLGYSAMDIITTLFRIVRSFGMDEYLKLEYIKVSCSLLVC